LRRKKFSLAIDMLMDYTLKTAMLARFSNARVTAGFDIAGRGACFSVGVIPSMERKAMFEHILDLVSGVAIFFDIEPERIPRHKPCLAISRESKEAAREFMNKQGVPEGTLIIGLHPGGNFPSQRWQPERFAQLADMIADKYQARVVIIGSGPEGPLVKKVAGLMRNRPVIAVGLPLNHLSGIIARMNILVCNNSGPLHIAAALGIPTVSTMGPTDPWLWRPSGENQSVIRKELACSPCNKAVCRLHRCMELITVDEVSEKVRDLLMKRGA